MATTAQGSCRARPELSVAPMMAWTTRHQRFMARILAPTMTLWTEMVVDQTVVHCGDKLWQHFGHDDTEHPLVLQLGGNSVEAMRQSAELANEWGFDEINLNVGCPSKTVAQKNAFGASLMLRPELVREIITTMQSVSSVPVTVKCRLGVDDQDDYAFLYNFVASIPECDHFIVHARKALLNGINTRQNRAVPPLIYERVYKLCEDFPDKKFSINGGIASVKDVQAVLEAEPRLHGVMLGRAAYRNPCLLTNLEYHILGNETVASLTRREVFDRYAEYAIEMSKRGYRTRDIVAPLGNLLAEQQFSKSFRKVLMCSDKPKGERNPPMEDLLQEARACLSDEILDKPIVDVSLDRHIVAGRTPLAGLGECGEADSDDASSVSSSPVRDVAASPSASTTGSTHSDNDDVNNKNNTNTENDVAHLGGPRADPGSDVSCPQSEVERRAQVSAS
ncbi:tRNA-dihydrouridine47 synthase NADP+-like [Hondaea fermentalgiana]|uniref:tRNA-dihydrouridine47 synthase NADP+-like n=1 Tax=Hondaea fermentalgiana TaxID=2315210 RepID=A0A2R5GJP1_9STRA|nr:tRNA-dihydrouridine47 synthase NADP+-like [Hondaea fermentalgiana]|eukprot:GBG28501.1 tRNA-dihydrouridine47 synthase NADP+-like [Hondaea fermentalgiana]